MYFDNNWYGDRYILSKYCSTKDKPAFASIQHGHNSSKILLENTNGSKKKVGEPAGKRRFSKLIPWLTWNEKIASYSVNNGYANVIPIGSVFLYVQKILDLKINKDSKGTLVFPLLSHPEQRNDIDYLRLISYLKKNHPAPYTISVSQFEYERSKNHFDKNAEVKLITFGTRGDKDYLIKLYNCINNHAEIFCTYPGSPILYSLYLKKKISLSEDYFLEKISKEYFLELNASAKFILDDFKEYGINVENFNIDTNKEKINDMLGTQHLKSPKEIKRLLGWDNIFKIIGSKILYQINNTKENFKHGKNHAESMRLGRKNSE